MKIMGRADRDTRCVERARDEGVGLMWGARGNGSGGEERKNYFICGGTTQNPNHPNSGTRALFHSPLQNIVGVQRDAFHPVTFDLYLFYIRST
jgi:hypothetical protein